MPAPVAVGDMAWKARIGSSQRHDTARTSQQLVAAAYSGVILYYTFLYDTTLSRAMSFITFCESFSRQAPCYPQLTGNETSALCVQQMPPTAIVAMFVTPLASGSSPTHRVQIPNSESFWFQNHTLNIFSDQGSQTMGNYLGATQTRTREPFNSSWTTEGRDIAPSWNYA